MRTAEDIVRIYTSVVGSHKRLPLSAAARLAAGERISVYSGAEQQWTSKVDLWQDASGLHAQMCINESLPSRMVAQLRAQQHTFTELVALLT